MPTRRVTLCAVVVLSTLAVTAARADAQDGGACMPSPVHGPTEFFPAAGAPDVPLNAPLRVRYDPGSSTYFTDPPSSLISLAVDDGTGMGMHVSGTAGWLGDTLTFVPTVPLRADTHYVGTVETAAAASGLQTFTFTTSTADDFMPPVINAISAVTSTVASVTCDAPDGGYRVTVTFDQAHDSDSARGDLEYLLYVTRAAETFAPTLEAHQRNFPSPTITMSFVLPRERATARVCVVVMAVDDLGHTAQTAETCVNPIQGNYFEPLCSVGALGASARSERRSGGVLAGAAVVALLAARRRRR